MKITTQVKIWLLVPMDYVILMVYLLHILWAAFGIPSSFLPARFMRQRHSVCLLTVAFDGSYFHIVSHVHKFGVVSLSVYPLVPPCVSLCILLLLCRCSSWRRSWQKNSGQRPESLPVVFLSPTGSQIMFWDGEWTPCGPMIRNPSEDDPVRRTPWFVLIRWNSTGIVPGGFEWWKRMFCGYEK